MKIQIILLFIFIFISPISNIAFSETLQIPYITEGVCPFEGCSYGIWNAQKDTSVFEKPNLKSKIISTIHEGEKVNVLTGNIYTNPGRAKVTDKSHRSVAKLNAEHEIFILEYIGEGYSKIYQDGKFSNVKIARTKDECAFNPNWRYCWVEVLEEPESNWWVLVELKENKSTGWVYMKDNPLKPIDLFS